MFLSLIFCSSLMLIAPEIFPKLYCIPYLWVPTHQQWLAQSLFSLSVFAWFRSQGLCISRSFQWPLSRCFGRMVLTHRATSLQHRLAGSLITTYIRHVRWQLSILTYNNYSPKSPTLRWMIVLIYILKQWHNWAQKLWFSTHLMLPTITILPRNDRTAAAVAFSCRQIKFLKALV